MIFSGSQVSGSYSTTPRSAKRATRMEWMPGISRSMPSIDCDGSQRRAGRLARVTHLHASTACHPFYSKLACFGRSLGEWLALDLGEFD